MQAHSAQDRATAARPPCSRPNWRFGRLRSGEERPSSPDRNLPPAQLAGSHGAKVTAGPRQLGTKAAGQAGSPRRAALVEPHAASTSLLSQRPTHPAHRPGRARPRGPSRRRQAAVKVRNGRPDVPAGCLRAACRAGAACCRSLCCAAARCLSARGLLQRPHPCSNPVQSGSSRGC